jgi:AcrR family transcriptional regulator
LPVVSQAERRAGTVAAIHIAARELFAKRGFTATTIDDIAKRAGVAKGAVYHHFGSKDEIFERVLEGIFLEIAARLRAAAGDGRGLFEVMVKGTEIYLERVTAPEVKRIVLVDGPAVLGWNKWREIDQRHFGRMLRAPLAQMLGGKMEAADIEAQFHLLSGAIMEAALIAATSKSPRKKVRELSSGLRRLLAGLVADREST